MFFTKSCSVSLKSITQGNELEEILANVRVPEVWQKMMVPHCKKSDVDDLLAPF